MMLVLSRKTDQKIFMTHPDGQITITVVEVKGSIVSIGIDAPRSVIIERDDLREKPEPNYAPCRKCPEPSFGDAGGLCFRCEQGERGD